MTTILIVEDELIARIASKKILEEEGHEVVLAATGKEGSATAKNNHQIEIIITDMGLPDYGAGSEGGIRLTREIRHAGIDTPIIGLSAADQLDQKKMLDAGANGFLSKPLNVDELRELIYELSPSCSSRPGA